MNGKFKISSGLKLKAIKVIKVKTQDLAKIY